jgi:homocysteine S-methyltransferase
MHSPFLTRLLNPAPVLFDGAMGTQLYARGVPLQRCFDELNLFEPDLVQAVHRAYIDAGAEVIETNTFAANRAQLTAFGRADKVREINLRGVKIAREAKEVSGQNVFIAGSVSSIGQPLAPIGVLDPLAARAIFVEQIEALLEAGVDLLVLETFGGIAELREAVLAAQSVSADLPLVASLSPASDGGVCSEMDTQLASEVDELNALDVTAIGINCGGGPQAALDALETIARHTTRPIVAMPNAGYPTLIGGRHHYAATPAYFADSARRLLTGGAKLIGGCCGTGPEHIAAMRTIVADFSSPATDRGPRPTAEANVAPLALSSAPDAASTAPESPLAQKVRAGRFIISVEVDPPRGLHPRKMLDGASLIRAAGADCVDIGDSPMARVRMNCVAFAALVEQHVGLETLIHFTTRDRNAMALQSDLLGAHALGIRNLIALTGDPPRGGVSPHATGVWDVDSIGFIKIIKQLNQGFDWAQNSIGRPTQFFVACAVNPMANDLELELDRYHRKVEAGADVAITQPLYDLEQLHRFLDRVPHPPIPTIVEIMPLQSSKHAEFCHNELDGVVIPEGLLRTMREAGERGIDVGLRQAHTFLTEVLPLVQGVLFVPSFHRYEMVCELVRECVRLRQSAPSEEVAA